MSLIEELQQLQELPDPTLPGFWPSTWGWWVLLALLLVLAFVVLVVWLRRRHANAYRRAAMAELDRLHTHWQQAPNDIGPLRDIPGVLKRAVLARLGTATPGIAGMSGNDWQHMLTRMARTPLPPGFAHTLALLAYADTPTVQELDLAHLMAQCRHWLETHDDPV